MPDPGEPKFRQEYFDRFYWENGPCCCGCDLWVAVSHLLGECTKSAPVSAEERITAIGLHSLSLSTPAGHALTKIDDHCGDFKDDFDWSQLSLGYLKRIGADITKLRNGD